MVLPSVVAEAIFDERFTCATGAVNDAIASKNKIVIEWQEILDGLCVPLKGGIEMA